MRRGEMRVWTKGFCVGIYNEGGLNATRLAMEEEDRRKVGTKSRPNRRRPRKAGVKFFLVCPALPNFFFFERSGKKVQTDGENDKNISLRTINLSGPPNIMLTFVMEDC